MTSSYPVSFVGTFGGTQQSNGTYTFPSSAQTWGGFAVVDSVKESFANTTIEDGNYITFQYSTNADVSIKFKFEFNPYPNTEPSFYTDNILLTAGSGSKQISLSGQGANTFNSFLLYIVERDIPVTLTNIVYNFPAPAPSSEIVFTYIGTNNDNFNSMISMPISIIYSIIPEANINSDLYQDGTLEVMRFENKDLSGFNSFGKGRVTISQTNLLQGYILKFRYFKQDSNHSAGFSASGPLFEIDGDLLVNEEQTGTAETGMGVNNRTGFQLKIWKELKIEPPAAPAPICFPAGTPVTTDQGNIPIEKLKSHIHTIRGNSIVAITQTRTLKKHIVSIEKDALVKNVPSQTTHISKNHKVFFEGQMVKARDLVDVCEHVHFIPYNGEILYNVLLKKDGKMMINNLICETLSPTNIMALISKISDRTEKNEKIRKITSIINKNDVVEYKNFYASLK